MTGRTRRWLPVVVVALVGLGIALWLGIGQAMDQNPCQHDCPLAIVNADLSVEAPSGADSSTGPITLDGVIVPPRDCASAIIAIDVYGYTSNRADGEFVGHGADTTEGLRAGQDWPFEIVVSGTEPQDGQQYYYDLSELSCRRAD